MAFSADEQRRRVFWGWYNFGVALPGLFLGAIGVLADSVLLAVLGAIAFTPALMYLGWWHWQRRRRQ
ncbi:hypothetical protein [Solicola sp. PLA-1-18]|uniref:hypothetical protein n=1 Tax=Solicola sp. PLA-1-18 TaxID=3380532 RepID=UPI003B7838AE